MYFQLPIEEMLHDAQDYLVHHVPQLLLRARRSGRAIPHHDYHHTFPTHQVLTALPGQTEGNFVIKNFRFTSDEVLAELHLHYVPLGHPHRNKAGAIDNAVLLHSTGGSIRKFFDVKFGDSVYGAGSRLDLSKFSPTQSSIASPASRATG